MVGGLAGMGHDRAPDRGGGLGDRAHLVELAEPRADRQQGPDPGRPRAGDNRFALGPEIGKVEMAVAVDEHYRPALPATHADGASIKRGKMPSGFGNCVPATSGDPLSAAKSRDPMGTESWSRSFAAEAGTKGCTRIAR